MEPPHRNFWCEGAEWWCFSTFQNVILTGQELGRSMLAIVPKQHHIGHGYPVAVNADGSLLFCVAQQACWWFLTQLLAGLEYLTSSMRSIAVPCMYLVLYNEQNELIFFWIRFEHAGSALCVDLILGLLEMKTRKVMSCAAPANRTGPTGLKTSILQREKWTTQCVFEIRRSTTDFPYGKPLLNLPSSALLHAPNHNGARIISTLPRPL